MLVDFLNCSKRAYGKQSEALHTMPNIDITVIKLNNLQLNALYYVCGYIVSSISKTQKICDTCIASAGSKIYDPKIQYSRLARLKCYRAKTLFFCE